MWISAMGIPDWQSISACPRDVLPFKIHDNNVLKPYSVYSFLILGLARFARYAGKTLVVAPEKKNKKKIDKSE